MHFSDVRAIWNEFYEFFEVNKATTGQQEKIKWRKKKKQTERMERNRTTYLLYVYACEEKRKDCGIMECKLSSNTYCYVIHISSVHSDVMTSFPF